MHSEDKTQPPEDADHSSVADAVFSNELILDQIAPYLRIKDLKTLHRLNRTCYRVASKFMAKSCIANIKFHVFFLDWYEDREDCIPFSALLVHTGFIFTWNGLDKNKPLQKFLQFIRPKIDTVHIVMESDYTHKFLTRDVARLLSHLTSVKTLRIWCAPYTYKVSSAGSSGDDDSVADEESDDDGEDPDSAEKENANEGDQDNIRNSNVNPETATEANEICPRTLLSGIRRVEIKGEVNDWCHSSGSPNDREGLAVRDLLEAVPNLEYFHTDKWKQWWHLLIHPPLIQSVVTEDFILQSQYPNAPWERWRYFEDHPPTTRRLTICFKMTNPVQYLTDWQEEIFFRAASKIINSSKDNIIELRLLASYFCDCVYNNFFKSPIPQLPKLEILYLDTDYVCPRCCNKILNSINGDDCPRLRKIVGGSANGMALQSLQHTLPAVEVVVFQRTENYTLSWVQDMMPKIFPGLHTVGILYTWKKSFPDWIWDLPESVETIELWCPLHQFLDELRSWGDSISRGLENGHDVTKFDPPDFDNQIFSSYGLDSLFFCGTSGAADVAAGKQVDGNQIQKEGKGIFRMKNLKHLRIYCACDCYGEECWNDGEKKDEFFNHRKESRQFWRNKGADKDNWYIREKPMLTNSVAKMVQESLPDLTVSLIFPGEFPGEFGEHGFQDCSKLIEVEYIEENRTPPIGTCSKLQNGWPHRQCRYRI